MYKLRIPYVGGTKQWGRAEFLVCPRWKRGHLVGLTITRMQQENHGERFELEGLHSEALSIHSWSGTPDPKVWRHVWCREHKCMAIEFYVPDGTDELAVDDLSTLIIVCQKKGKT